MQQVQQTILNFRNIHLPHSLGQMMRTLAHSFCSIVAEMRQIHMDYQVLWRNRDGMATLSRGERLALALTDFYCFFWHITLRMVLIYYAKVRFGWLPFTENKGEDVANYIKKEGYLQM